MEPDIGRTDAGDAARIAAPEIELRFIIDKGGDCGAFQVAEDAGGAGAVPTPRAAGPLAVSVCTFQIPATWAEAHLSWQGSAAVLTSLISYGDGLSDLQPIANQSPATGYVHGPSWGRDVIVKGPAWIGARGGLRMVSIGDTGCRGRPSDEGRRGKQYCGDVAANDQWPLATLSRDAAGHAPDFVIHVGDYRYYFENHWLSADQTVSDTWSAWQKDFFPAAQPLLLAAPWVFLRGNREHCATVYPHTKLYSLPYGPGYFQFFGSSAGESCADLDARGDFMRPSYFDVAVGTPGVGNDTTHRFAVVDTNIYGSAQSGQLTTDFATAHTITQAGPVSAWWATHVPGLQHLYYSHSGHGGESVVRDALTQAAGAQVCSGTGYPKCRPSVVLIGHQHLYQDVIFADEKGDGPFPGR